MLADDEMDVFEEEMGCDFCVFRGVTVRSKYCKLRCLDFRGLKLSKHCISGTKMYRGLKLSKHFVFQGQKCTGDSNSVSISCFRDKNSQGCQTK